MREIPGYNRYINERFERCMDLYLCPRQQKMRVSGIVFLTTCTAITDHFFPIFLLRIMG